MINRQEIKTEMNIVPFIDVILVLLIVFMMASPMINHGVEVELPQASSDTLETLNENKMIIWSIDKNGFFYLTDEDVDSESPMEMKEMIAYTKSIYKQFGENLNIYLRADKNISYEYVITSLTSIKSIGIKKVNLMTQDI